MARPRLKLTAPIIREPVLHRQIADVLRLELAAPRYPSRHGVVWFSLDMAAYAGEFPGIRTGRGCVAGVPDIFLSYRGRAHWIEVKAADGVLSPAQASCIIALLLSDCRCAVARDAWEALAALDEWGIPRAHRIEGEPR